MRTVYDTSSIFPIIPTAVATVTLSFGMCHNIIIYSLYGEQFEGGNKTRMGSLNLLILLQYSVYILFPC